MTPQYVEQGREGPCPILGQHPVGIEQALHVVGVEPLEHLTEIVRCAAPFEHVRHPHSSRESCPSDQQPRLSVPERNSVRGEQRVEDAQGTSMPSSSLVASPP